MFRKILIDLDSLLDTRLGTIRLLNKDAANKLVTNGQVYWHREMDDWTKLTDGLVTNEQFVEAYSKRGGENTADTINSSIFTGIIPFIIQLIAQSDLNRLDGIVNANFETCLEVNIWPYELTPDAQDELLYCLHKYIGDHIQITLINTQLTDLTCSRLNSIYSMAIMYNFGEWCKTHVLELGQVLMPDFTIIGPKLFEKDVSELAVEDKQFIIMDFQLKHKLNIDFDFIDAEYFSMFKP
ncbi:hypothetical protein FDI90_gp225 [Pseudomonas phage PA7]|uniref:PHIKZ147 n=2 Tax=Phikzvirus TaxID=680115 RepID=Q8SD15_BPDPK|nr:PHIKZ147 [Pseudomonas phage phiKZ]YP_009617513.1 hypothetical protein FDI90_gp225 [Pseudomonas phage PA7]AAL83048.1 PHIKZ147 [Pseudomonas phage phiKZ]AFO71032.1 hypothetical protein [Pseudomonas phage PA7]BDR25072.1 hypothetical protein RVBP14_2380 [Pseudomonas phage sp. Brmt]